MNEPIGAATTVGSNHLGISADLLKILVCPVDHGTLEVIESGLRCSTCQRVYPVQDGVPSMVVDADSAVG